MAKGEKKRKGRREHLNDFRVDLNGEYIYEGARLFPQGTELSDFCKKAKTATAALTVLVLIPGFIIGNPTASGWYLIVPWIVEIIAAALLISAASNLKPEKEGLREYRYTKGVKDFPARLMVLTVGAGLDAIGAIVCAVTGGDSPVLPIVLILISLLTALCALYVRKRIQSVRWKKAEQ